MSELLLVAVPGVRIEDQGALLRVLLVPRLTGPGTTLESYGLTDWPAVVSGARFTVHLTGAGGAELEPFELPCHSDGDSAVWRAFFPPGLPVRPFVRQRTFDDPRVRRTSAHAARIDALYAETVRRRGDPEVVQRRLAELELEDAAPILVDVDAPVAPFEPPDFHRAVALLREHPFVLRALGLIIDLHVPSARIDAAGHRGDVRIEWPDAPDGVGRAHGRATAYELAEGRFLPRSTRMITRGLVDLGTHTVLTTLDRTGTTTQHEVPDWVVTSVDVDAAAARLNEAKRTLGSDAGRPANLPALRTIGLTLLRRARGEELARRNARAADNASRASAADGPALTADDLVLGYRLDVRRPGREWHSLTRRRATYRVAPRPTGSGPTVTIGGGAVDEEGHHKPAAGVIGTDGTLRTDEVVARWSGTNLAIPAMPPPLVPGVPERAVDSPHERMPYEFTWTFVEDPTGPPDLELLFGTDYQLRLRVVDLAGGGLALGDPPRDRAASPRITYRRWEPVAPPVIPPPRGLIHTDRDERTVDSTFFGPGGSLDVLVVRSDPRGDDPRVELGARLPPNDSRMLLPPAITFALAEQHGVLSGTDEETARRARRAMVPPRASAEARNGRNYTWLPDPVIDSISAVAVPLGAGTASTSPAIEAWAAETWPDYSPKLLRLSRSEEGEPIRAEWNPIGTLEVRLPPGGQADLELSSSLASGLLNSFAAGAWVGAATGGPGLPGVPGEPGEPAASPTVSERELASFTTSGRHPTVSPPRTVRLVHAVRRPLAVPRGVLRAARAPGDTGVTLTDPEQPAFGVHRHSTGQVDVVASWDEWGDAPKPTLAREVVQSLPVDLAGAPLPPIRHEFGDTRYRRISYQLTARSRFRQFFGPDDPDRAFRATVDLAPVDVPSTARPVPPVVVSIVPAFRWTETTPDPIPIPGLVRDPAGPGPAPQDGDAVETPVPERRPAEEVPFLTRHRSGGHLRVELGRPWYTTGADERLAVVVAPAAPGAPTAVGRTSLYRDPVYATPPPARQPVEAAMGAPGFRLAHVTDPDDPDGVRQLTVALFEVRYDGVRPFADVRLPVDDASYGPLVQLTLARYQEHSLPGLELSETVTTEAVAMLPSRRLVVDKQVDGVVVTLSGTSPTDVPNRVEVRLEASPTPRFAGTLSELGSGTGQGWVRVSAATGILGEPFDPIVPPRDGRSFRLVVTELENLEPLSATPAGRLEQELSRRVVFADVVQL